MGLQLVYGHISAVGDMIVRIWGIVEAATLGVKSV